MEATLDDGVRVEFDEPVVIALSEPGETRWGHHQFVWLSEYPGNRILARFHACADAVAAYGEPQPTYVSSDEGQTWEPFAEPGLPPAGITSRVFDGEFLCVPTIEAFDTKAHGIALPEPVAEFTSYMKNHYYRLSDFPQVVQDHFATLPAARWTPQTQCWREEQVAYDTHNVLPWARQEGAEAGLLPNTWLEHAPLKVGDELIYPDYRRNYVEDDGSFPKQRSVACTVSRDNGHSFQRRATIALDRTGSDLMGEPMLAQDCDGNLVCAIRRTDHRQKAMAITYSSDRGHTWEEPTILSEFGEFGVLPRIIRLDCGVVALSFGRPGVHIAFSLDGTARRWTKAVEVLPGDASNLNKTGDGYTSMLPLSPNELLLAYTDFLHQDADGLQRKAVLARRVRVNAASG